MEKNCNGCPVPLKCHLLSSISGVHYVFDTTFSRNFSLLESCREFLCRYRDSETSKTALPMLASACPGEKL